VGEIRKMKGEDAGRFECGRCRQYLPILLAALSQEEFDPDFEA